MPVQTYFGGKVGGDFFLMTWLPIGFLRTQLTHQTSTAAVILCLPHNITDRHTNALQYYAPKKSLNAIM